MQTAIAPRHLAIAILVMAIWGTNFPIAHAAFRWFPPLLFVALRFGLLFAVIAPFVPRPRVPLGNLAAYGLAIGLFQFGVVYVAMRSQITPGLASLVLQTQAIFTMILAARTAGEVIRPPQWAAVGLAACGVLVIMFHTDGHTTPLGLAMALFGACSWAVGNMVSRRAGPVDMVAYIGWSAMFPTIPLVLLSLWFDGAGAVGKALTHAPPLGWLAVFWQVFGNSLFGFGFWAWLLSRYPAGTIAPLSLLVPLFGIGTSIIVFHEPFAWWKIAAMGLIVSGVLAGLLLSPRGRGKVTAPPTDNNPT